MKYAHEKLLFQRTIKIENSFISASYDKKQVSTNDGHVTKLRMCKQWNETFIKRIYW